VVTIAREKIISVVATEVLESFRAQGEMEIKQMEAQLKFDERIKKVPTIEAFVHLGRQAKKLGFDLYTYQGNLGFTKWLYDHYGSAPWKYSQGCWGSYQT
jgi:hypothetical protein